MAFLGLAICVSVQLFCMSAMGLRPTPKKSTETLLYTKKLPSKDFSTVSITGNRAGNMMPTIGNGYVASVLYSDTVHVSGLYNGKAYSKFYPIYPINITQHTHRARLPSTCSLAFEVFGIEGDSSYALDIKKGIFYKWFDTVVVNETLRIEQRFYAHRQLRHLIVVELTIKNDLSQNVTLNISNNFGEYTKDIGLKQWTWDKKLGMEMAFGAIKTVEEVDSLKSKVAIAFQDIPDHIVIGAHEWRTWYFVTAIATSVDTKFDPWRQAETSWRLGEKRDRFLQWHHVKAWEEIWKSGSIDIEGNLELSQAVYASMYQILSSTRADWPYGLSPGSLSGGEEYMGHTFWDQDIWMFPFLLLLYPDLARASLKYRYDRLPAARRIARANKYRGAMFPWESSLTGIETSPGRKYGKHQVHITGDVAYTARIYWYATKDIQWLRHVGFDLVYQTADFWGSRAYYNKEKDQYEINYVMPPDEYQFPVDNSFYTNVVAKQNLEFALECGRILNRYVPPYWAKLAAKMYIPFDEERQFHPEFDDFHDGLKTKQADAILAGYPLMYNMTKQVRYNDLEIYENITDPNGPAMTHAMTAIGWLEVGKKKRADKAFLRNFDNINGPFKVWTENINRKGAVNFITGAGGFLQAVLFGYGGFRIREDHLEFNPTLTPSSKKLTISGVDYLGNSMDFVIKNKRVMITLTTKKEIIAPKLDVVSYNKTYNLVFNKPVSIMRGKGKIQLRK